MSMSPFARDIALRMHHRACLIERGHVDVAADLRDIAAMDLSTLKTVFAAYQREILAGYGYDPETDSKPFAYAGGVAIIPIHGMLVNRMSWASSFATGYDFIRSQRAAALADDDVDLLVYDVNSSGGLATGCDELAKTIYEGRGQKPSLAVVDARAYSAAYYLASACDSVYVTPSGGVGSIGAAAMHVDLSEALDKEGIKLSFIYEGAEKVDGNMYEPLSKRARESIQRDVSYHYGLFVEAVARHRGLSEDDVRATEARCYLPPEALELGLIDGIKTPIEALAAFSSESTEDQGMTTEKTAVPAVSTAAVTTALTADDVAKMVAEGVAAGISAERTRAGAIRGCTEAKGRENLAAHLAENTALSIEDAKAVLAAAPLVAAESGTSRQAPSAFAAAMDRTVNPNVGADPAVGEGATGSGDDSSPGGVANRLLGNYTALTGRKVHPINRAA